MRLKHALLFSSFITIFLASLTLAQQPNALQSSSIMNPNISAIGWFQAEAGHRQTEAESDAFALKEVELAVQSNVDAYSRADIIISFSDEGAEVEEGTLSWFALPHNLALKAGKFKANFGRFNRIHTAETAFADRPLVEEAYFGEEGLGGAGASLSWQIPNPLFLLNWDVEAMTAPEVDETPAFDKARKKDLLYVTRLGGFVDVTEASNFTFGSSFAHGPAGQELNVDNSSTTLTSQVVGLDLTFRWKNPRRSIYRSFVWNTEALWNHRDITTASVQNSWGLFSHIEYQFARRWRTGARYDYSESPLDKTIETKGGLAYVTFTPSEFSLISLQGRHVRLDDGTEENLAFLKTTFSVGPHGAHPF
jgi:hypothetical protein